MVQFLPCPGCRRQLILPEQASAATCLRCPECGRQQSLGAILESEFSSWIVVDDASQATPSYSEISDTGIRAPGEINSPPAKDGSAESANSPAMPIETTWTLGSEDETRSKSEVAESDTLVWAEQQGAESTDAELDASLAQEAEPLSSQANSSSWMRSAPSPAAATEPWGAVKSGPERTSRRRRKRNSPVWSAVQIVLGGLAAFPIALLLLWWVVGQDFAGAGPIVGKYVPWLVPQRFRPNADYTPKADRTPLRLQRSSGLPQLSNESMSIPTGQSADSTASAAASGRQHAVETIPGANQADEIADQILAGAGTQAKNGTSGTDPIGGENTNVSQDLQRLVSECEQHLADWRRAVNGGSGDLRAVAQAFYRALIDLTQLLNSSSVRASGSIAALQAQLQPISRELRRNSDVQSIVIQGASYWCNAQSNSNAFPLALIVEPTELARAGDAGLWVKASSSSLPDGIDRILLPEELRGSVVVGEKLFVLGRVEAVNTIAPSSETSGERLLRVSYAQSL